MKVYLAGPMSNLANFNVPAFNAAAADLRDQGHEVVNPAELTAEHGTDQPWEFYMKRGLKALMDCERIVLLPGWENSRGATLEADIAIQLGIQAVSYDTERR